MLLSAFQTCVICMVIQLYQFALANQITDKDRRIRDLEDSFERYFGRTINMTKLLQQFDNICPLTKTCSSTLSYDNGYRSFAECRQCSCYKDCVLDYSCCPDVIYGYLEFERVNVIQFPPTKTYIVPMIASCPYNTDQEYRSKCKNGKVEPVSSFDSDFNYKNIHCAVCHGEDNPKSWELTFQCPPRTPDVFKEVSSVKQFKKLMIAYECVSIYQKSHYDNYGNYMKSHLDRAALIDRCNITGKWKTYDADIENGCHTLQPSFYIFKNVFCYICNPSTEQITDNVISECNVTGKWHDDRYDEKIEKLCVHGSNFDRLLPYKNIYCMICNGIKSFTGALEWTSSNSKSLNVSSVYNFDSSRLRISTDITIDVVLSGDANKELVTVVSDAFADQMINFNSDSQLIINTKRQRALVTVNETDSLEKYFKDVCGQKLVCNASGIESGSSASGKKEMFCKKCRCDSGCAEDMECCNDLLLFKEPYMCLKGKYFATSHSEWSGKENVPGENLVIHKCIDPTYTQSHIIHLCEGMEYEKDPLAFIPVAVYKNSEYVRNKVAYKNVYCFLCNVHEPHNVLIQLQLTCNAYIETVLFTSLKHLMGATQHFCRTYFQPINSERCGNSNKSLSESASQHPRLVRRFQTLAKSGLDPAITQAISDIYETKQSLNQTIYDKCNMTKKLAKDILAIKKICEDTHNENILALNIYTAGNRLYKNFACFICNPTISLDESISKLAIGSCNETGAWTLDLSTNIETEIRLCQAGGDISYWWPFTNGHCAKCNLPKADIGSITVDGFESAKKIAPQTYRVLFSLSPELLDNVKTDSGDGDGARCTQGTFDNITKTCLQIVCPRKHFFREDKCVPLSLSVTNRVYYLQAEFLRMNTADITSNNITQATLNSGNVVSCNDVLTVVYNVINNKLYTLDLINNKFHILNLSVSVDSRCNDSSAFFPTDEFSTINMEAKIIIQYTNNITCVEEMFASLQKMEFKLKTTTSDILILLQGVTPRGKTGLCECYLSDLKMFLPRSISADDSSDNITIVNSFMHCPRIELSDTDIDKLEDTEGHIRLVDKGVKFGPGEFFSEHGTTIVCLDTYRKRLGGVANEPILKIDTSQRMPFVYYIFSLVCSTLSLTGLFVTFLVYCFLKELRTEPGINNMFLCITLFFAQLFLQFGLSKTQNNIICIFMGICIHFFWLATFCSMNVCCYHMFNVFYLQELRAHILTKRWKYITYTFSLPVVLIILTVSIHLSLSGGSSTGYTGGVCFLSDVYTIIGAFIGPSVLMFMSNIVFFIVTAVKIHSRPSIQSSSHNNKLDFLIYVKLYTIIGVTWPLQIADSAMTLTIFSFFVVTMNALQGVFVFLSYVCNRRVLKLLQLRFACKRTESISESFNDGTLSTQFSRSNNGTQSVKTSTALSSSSRC